MNITQIRKFSPELYRLAEKYGILKIQVFGSSARGEDRPESDVDFLLDMKQGVSLMRIAGFAYEAEKLLGVRVDVFPTSILPKVKDRAFVENIIKDAKPL
jgi:predicted nucleotidyltransferase